MLKRIIICALLVVFNTMTLAPAMAQQDMDVDSKLTAIETMIYGASLSGGILDRVNRLENDIYGSKYNGSILRRVDVLYDHVMKTTESSPSMLTKINAVEWLISHSITYDPIQSRISNLEKIIGGAVVAESLDDRLDNLVNVTFSNEQIEIVPAILARDSLIRVKTLTPINSSKSKAGDIVEFVVSEDLFIGSVLIVPQGAKGSGKIVKAEPAKNFGRDAKLEVSFDNVSCINGGLINTLLGDKAKEETKSLAKATGASVAGMFILGPVGIIGGAFVSGKNIDMPAGTQLYVQTANDEEIFGVTVK